MSNYSATRDIRHNLQASTALTDTSPTSEWAQSFFVKILGTVWYYKKSIISTLLGTTFLFWGAGQIFPPSYKATAQIYIDPKGIQIFDNDPNSSRNTDSLGSMTIVESQVRVINSLSVLQKVVEQENLIDDVEFFKPTKASLLNKAKNAKDINPSVMRASDALFRAITIKRAERTFVVDVTVKANDPIKSANLANAVTQAYLDSTNEARQDNSRKASHFLNSRLDELREKVRKAEDMAETYKAKNNLLGARGTQVTEQQLSDANYQISTARARVSDAQSRFEQIAIAKKSGDISGITEAVNSQTIGSLRSMMSDARRKQSELMLELGVKHPLVLNAKAQVDDIGRMINEELNRIAEAMKNDLERAKSTEKSVMVNLEKAKVQAAENNQANVQLRELEREVEASRQLYNSFLVRARETGEFEKLDTSNTRIISKATAPFKASFPPSGLLLILLGIVVGGLLGLGQAFGRSFLKRVV